MDLVYPRGFYEHQMARGRPTGHLVAQSALQVKVTIGPEDMEQLRLDAAAVAPESSGESVGLRLVAKGTLSRIRMARQLAVGLRKGLYSEQD